MFSVFPWIHINQVISLNSIKLSYQDPQSSPQYFIQLFHLTFYSEAAFHTIYLLIAFEKLSSLTCSPPFSPGFLSVSLDAFLIPLAACFSFPRPLHDDGFRVSLRYMHLNGFCMCYTLKLHVIKYNDSLKKINEILAVLEMCSWSVAFCIYKCLPLHKH